MQSLNHINSSERDWRINWPLAIVASLIFHAAVLGTVFFFSDDGAKSASATGQGELTAENVNAATGGRDDLRESAGGSAPANGDAPATAGSAGGPATVAYTVKPGDSLSKIAKKYGCTVKDIADLNGFPAGKMLSIGETLNIPQ